MFRKSFISIIFVVAAMIGSNASVFAQSAPVNGKVELEKADGTREPVVGALVEPYRMDIKASLPAAKTNKKGEFAFAGFPFGGTFVLSISAPGCSPYTFSNVRAGQEKLLIIVSPGDGRKFTEDEVRKAVAVKAPSGGGGGQTTELTAEQKKAQADLEAKRKEIEESNKKATNVNEIINRVQKEGSDAFNAKNYDLAIAKYEEGIAADPDFVGSAPVFLNNKGASLGARAVETYNKAVKMTDASEKFASYNLVKKDLADAADSYLRAWNLEKNAPAADIADRNNYEETKLSTLRGAYDTFWKAVKTERVDPSLIETAKTLMPEYLNAEKDAAKKAAASITFADLYRISEDRETAVASYKKVLETYPDNADALAYLGILLVDLGWLKDNDKALSQEGANYLQKFVSIAPDTHKLKSGAIDYLNILKTQSIIPVKQTTTKKKP